jgi:hypothetical protein
MGILVSSLPALAQGCRYAKETTGKRKIKLFLFLNKLFSALKRRSGQENTGAVREKPQVTFSCQNPLQTAI